MKKVFFSICFMFVGALAVSASYGEQENQQNNESIDTEINNSDQEDDTEAFQDSLTDIQGDSDLSTEDDEEFFDATDEQSRIDKQKEIDSYLLKAQDSIAKISDLNYITEKSLKITLKSLKQLKKDVSTAVVEINLYDNYTTVIEETLSQILFVMTDDRAVKDNIQEQWNKLLKGNADILRYVQNLQRRFKALSEKGIVDLDDEDQSTLYKNVLIDYANIMHIIDEKKDFVESYPSCVKFIKSSYDITRQIYVKYYTEKVLKEFIVSSKKSINIPSMVGFVNALNMISSKRVSIDSYIKAVSNIVSNCSISLSGSESEETLSISLLDKNVNMSELDVEIFCVLKVYMDYISNYGVEDYIDDKEEIDTDQLKLHIDKIKKKITNKTKKSDLMDVLEKHLKSFKVIPQSNVVLGEVSDDQTDKLEDILEQQKSVVLSEGLKTYNTISNRAALHYITNNNLLATPDTIEQFAKDPTSTIIHLDLYDHSNYAIAIAKAFNNILDGSLKEYHLEEENEGDNDTESLNEDSTEDSETSESENVEEVEYTSSWYKAIYDNKLEGQLGSVRDKLSELAKCGTIDLSDKNQYDIYNQVLIEFAKLFDEIDKVSEFEKQNKSLYEFLQLSHEITRLVFVRYSTEKTLSEIRKELEDIQHQTLNKSVHIPVLSPLMKFLNSSSSMGVGKDKTIDLGVVGYMNQLSQGSSSFSFCSVDTNIGVQGSLGLNINLAKIAGSFDYSNVASEIYYSLEAYMDYLNTKGLVFIDRLQSKVFGMREALEDRRKMQRLETIVLKKSGMFERYLKLLKVIPEIGVVVDWIDVTKSIAKDTVSGSSKKVGLEASIGVNFADLNVKAQYVTDNKTYMKGYSVLSMIDSDCSINKKFTFEDMNNFIGSEYNLLKHPYELFNRISHSNKKIKQDEKEQYKEDFTEKEQIELVNILRGYLNEYVMVLEQLATITMGKDKDVVYGMVGVLTDTVSTANEMWQNITNKDRKQIISTLESKKHKYEKILLPKGKKGREDVLKAAVITSAMLKNVLSNKKEYDLSFKKLYEQIVRLGRLCEFSKNSSDELKEIYNTAQMNSTELRLDVGLKMEPYELTANAVSKEIKGSPFITENGKYVSLSYELPLIAAGIIGMQYMQQKSKDLFTGVSDHVTKTSWSEKIKDFNSIGSGITTYYSKEEGEKAYNEIKSMKNIVKDNKSGAINTITNVVIPGLMVTGLDLYQKYNSIVHGASQFYYNWRCIEPTPVNKKIKPLPDSKEVIKIKDKKWVLDYVTITSKVNVDDCYVGRIQKRTGSDSLHDLMSKYSVLSKGIIDSKSGDSTVLDSLMEEQVYSILKMFKNIAQMKGNITYELQMLYNDLISLYENNSEEYKEITELFREFINDCKNLYKTEEDSDGSSVNDSNDMFGNDETKSLLDETDEDRKPSSKQYEIALKSFRKILDKQYNLIFLPYYNNSFKKRTGSVSRVSITDNGQETVRRQKLMSVIKSSASVGGKIAKKVAIIAKKKK